MKKNNSLFLYVGFALVALFFILVGLKIYFELNFPKLVVPELSYVLSPVKTDLKVGEKISVPVYLTGKDAGKTSAYDVKFYYDATKFKLTKTTPGGFFEKYITVKWDQSQAWYALALTPSTPRVEAQPTLPMLTLELTAIGKTTGTPVTTGTSTVYLTKTGGFHPQTGTVNFTIK